MKRKFLRNTLPLLAAVGMVAIPTKALAHQVQSSYILKPQIDNPTEETLEIRSAFSNNQPLKGAKVTVYAPDQSFRPHITGVTDSQGRFSFNPDETMTGEWEVKIKQGGHSDMLRVPVNEAGIDENAVARGPEIEDIHYASSPLPVVAVGSLAIAAACIGVVGVGRLQRKAKQ